MAAVAISLQEAALSLDRLRMPQDAYFAATVAQYNLVLDQAAETSLLFIEFRRALTAALTEIAGSDGEVTIQVGHRLTDWLRQRWPALWSHWLTGDPGRPEIQGFAPRREQAAQFAIDAHRLLHAYYFAPIRALTEQENLFGGAVKAPDAPPFTSQTQAVLDAADRQLIGSPPKTWSQRLWTHQNGGLNAMTQRIQQAVINKESAWDLAKALEEFLYVDARWTRWTRSRLFAMTPADRILTAAGLVRKPRTILPGAAPPTRGVAYNALRLARTELQAIHNLAARNMMLPAPWVDRIRIMRSASATACEICDPVGGPPGGDGVAYEKREAPLNPFHPHCLCYQLADLMPREQFVAQVRGWVRGENTFLDDYRPYMGQDTALMQSLASMPLQQTMAFPN